MRASQSGPDEYEYMTDPGTLLAHRESLFVQFVKEIPDMLRDLRTLAGDEPASLVGLLERLDSGLSLSDFWRWPEADRNWLVSRLGTLLGEIEIMDAGGSWYLPRRSDEPYFAQFVVIAQKPAKRYLDPMGAAMRFFAKSSPRSLTAALVEMRMLALPWTSPIQ
jgi:hypothetical protein